MVAVAWATVSFFLYIRYETIRVRTISWWISQLQLFTTMFGEVLQVTFTSPPCNSSIVAFSSNVKQKTSQFINYTEESRIYLPYSPRFFHVSSQVQECCTLGHVLSLWRTLSVEHARQLTVQDQVGCSMLDIVVHSIKVSSFKVHWLSDLSMV